MQAFQKPLSKETEHEYLIKSRQGNQEARSILIERNLRLVAHIAKKYTCPERDTEDILQTGTIGLIKAIDTYDIEKGHRLVTYASRCIENEILMMLRQEKKNAKDISLYEPIGTDKEGNEINLLDIIDNRKESIPNQLIKNQNLKILTSILPDRLTSQEYRVIVLRYGLNGEEPHTQKEVSGRLGISRSYVSRIEKKALQKLKACF